MSYTSRKIWVNAICFFFKQKTAYEVRISDWSSDVCSSDLGVPLFDDDGRFLGYRGTGRNLTEEYRARRMAFEAQDLLLQAIEHFTSAVALFDRDDRLLLFNDSYVQMFGPGADSNEIGRASCRVRVGQSV